MLCERAKLFRYDDENKEWKERGLGEVKLLKNCAAYKVRLVMRRDQTHKVCANHLLTAEMTLTPMASSGKAWVWAANDFADEDVKMEKFAIRFKTPELVRLQSPFVGFFLGGV
ncbi:UNVERIFIED_CONTAM: hypothetical protein GTU68_023820 [Idotea baltica]|nr:hypothetical protein [Idotea baltica]